MLITVIVTLNFVEDAIEIIRSGNAFESDFEPECEREREREDRRFFADSVLSRIQGIDNLSEASMYSLLRSEAFQAIS